MKLDHNFSLEAVRVAEAAAIASYDWIGHGDEHAADQAAVNAMRIELNKMMIDGTVVIGEGERDKAPMLYIGEKVGISGPQIDIALDPLEGTTICATAGSGSMAVIAFASHGGFLHAPDLYMDKIAVGGISQEGIIDLDNSPSQNLKNIAKAKNIQVSDLIVTILKRERHAELIAQVREAGARVKLIGDGDVAAVINAATSNFDVYMGTGGAPEGVLAAAALASIGGQMMGRLIFSSDADKERATKMNIIDFNRQYQVKDMARGEVIFAATGVTDGALLEGVHKFKDHYTTNSIVMHSASKTVRNIKTQHSLLRL